MKKIIIHIIRRFAGVIIGLDLAESIKEQKQVENIRKSLKSCGEKVAFKLEIMLVLRLMFIFGEGAELL